MLVLDMPRRIGYIYGPKLMSRFRKWWVILRNPHATIRFTEPVYLGPGFSIHVPDGGTFIAGPGTEFRRNFRCELVKGAKVEIGTACGFSYDVLIQSSVSITLGDRCFAGQSCLIVDGNHRFRDHDTPMLAQGYDLSPVVFEDDVTLMTKVTVIGCRLGERSVVGANSVAVKDVPPYTVVGGVPAKPISYFGPPGGEPPELVESASSR